MFHRIPKTVVTHERLPVSIITHTKTVVNIEREKFNNRDNIILMSVKKSFEIFEHNVYKSIVNVNPLPAKIIYS
jgi:hypothetical protein